LYFYFYFFGICFIFLYLHNILICHFITHICMNNILKSTKYICTCIHTRMIMFTKFYIYITCIDRYICIYVKYPYFSLSKFSFTGFLNIHCYTSLIRSSSQKISLSSLTSIKSRFRISGCYTSGPGRTSNLHGPGPGKPGHGLARVRLSPWPDPGSPKAAHGPPGPYQVQALARAGPTQKFPTAI